MTAGPPEFDAAFGAQLVELFRWRRDVRRFRRDPVAPALVEELLDLACLAPSVGHSQPWRFVLVETPGRRAEVCQDFLRCNREALAGYAGDVWFPQPPPRDHPWRTMPHHGMTTHISGTSLSAQARYAAGTREILESYFAKKPIRTEYLIVDKGKLAGAGAHSYTAGDTTKGSEEAAKFKKQPAKV